MKPIMNLFFRAIDINSLVGNIGGYIGLCLGYSILQIPIFIKKVVAKWISHRSSEEKEGTILSSKPVHVRTNTVSCGKEMKIINFPDQNDENYLTVMENMITELFHNKHKNSDMINKLNKLEACFDKVSDEF